MIRQQPYTALFNKISVPLTKAGRMAFEEMAETPEAARAYFNGYARRGTGLVQHMLDEGMTELAARGLSAGGRVADTIAGLKFHDRARVMAAPDVVGSMCRAGQAREAAEMLLTFSRENRTNILTVPHVVWSLANGGQAAHTLRLIKSLDMGQRAQVLTLSDAVPALVLNGYAPAAAALVRRLDAAARDTIAGNPEAVSALQRAGEDATVRRLQEDRASRMPAEVPRIERMLRLAGM